MNPKMSNIQRGTKALIKIWDKNPSFWDSRGDMMKIAMKGITHVVAEEMSPGRYRLVGIPNYCWREKDLLLAEINDPNILFRMRKRK